MVWVVFAVVVRFLVVGFGLLMIFWWALMWLVCFGFVWVLEFFVFFPLGFVASGGFQWWWWFPVWGGFAMEDAMVFWICSGGCYRFFGFGS